jgi:predicted nucleotide-binding protein
MSTFKGSINELKGRVQELGVSGTWSEIANGFSLRTPNGGILNWFPSTGLLTCQGKPSARPETLELIDRIGTSNSTATYSQSQTDAVTMVEEAGDQPVLFVVYGHDVNSRDQLELILTKLKVNHLILAKSNTDGKTIIEALENYIGRQGSAKAGIVLMTPDDMGYAARHGEKAIKPRARQNVVLELGMVMAKLGRENTIIVVKGSELERPSDTDGILYLAYQDHVKETVKGLVTRLNAMGFGIDPKLLLDVL